MMNALTFLRSETTTSTPPPNTTPTTASANTGTNPQFTASTLDLSDFSTMTSTFFSNILTTTSSKYNNLRRQLISSEADGDTEDDSHISRVLRAYYTEKGRGFPEWLPPDPKAPPPQQFVSSVNSQQQGYGGGQQPQGGRWGRGGLSDLWDGNKGQQGGAGETESLRQRPGIRGNSNSTNTSFGSQDSAQTQPGGRFSQQQNLMPEQQGRPLPSQRAGSYQSQFSNRFGGTQGSGEAGSPPTSSGGGSTAQERLKQRLWGAGRSGSPTPSQSSSASSPAASSIGSKNPYETNDNGGGRFSGASARPQDTGRQYGGQAPALSAGYGGGAPQQSSRPTVSANSPWAGGEDPYAPAGQSGYGSRSSGGLPSGPKAGRQGLGLPSGPRPKR